MSYANVIATFAVIVALATLGFMAFTYVRPAPAPTSAPAVIVMPVSATTPQPAGQPAGHGTPSPAGQQPELLTIPEAAVVTGLSVRALTRRIQRGTVPSEMHQGRRLVRRGELERLDLIGSGNKASDPGGELELYRELYAEQKQRADQAEAHVDELRGERDQLAIELARMEAAVAATSGFGAKRLKKLIAEARKSA